MNANELLKSIIASGADENGILDRFGDNVDLYERCFLDFLEDPGFTALRIAIQSRSYKQAFEAGHALKGLSGNLGITGFYDAIRTLTDSLRNVRYDNIDEEYAEVERQHERLKRVASGEPVMAQEAAPHLERKRARFPNFYAFVNDKSNRFFVYLICATIVVFTAVGFLFSGVNHSHKQHVVVESGQHLVEINNQIKLYIENNIAIDWMIARSVGNSILGSAYVDDDPAIFKMLREMQTVWGVSDLMLYTESGYCIYANGSTEVTDIASVTAYQARKLGRSFTIVDSRLIFTVPLNTTLTFHGSEIVAISVVRDMSTFLDDMDFSSFGGTAWVYLTDQNGVVVSSLTGPSTVQAYSIQAVTQEMDITPLQTASSPEDFINNQEIAVFLLSSGTSNVYGVCSPIITEADPMGLFYFVPENAVNGIMGGFSQQLMTTSMIVIFLFACVSIISFLFVYRNRKNMFDRAIRTREHMFDLLIKNTRTAFGLFTVNNPQPSYFSANAAEVIGDSYWALEKTDAGFRIHNDKNIETENIALANEELKRWDGKSTYRSGYLCNTQSATATYFTFELYPTDDRANDFVGIAQDVTLIYAREEAAKKAMESAKNANDAKTRFLSNMSHDIRTPMNAIINMSSFALECVDQPKKLGNYLRVIHDSAEHLLHLINDVLDMSRIENGQLVVASAPFDVKEEVQRQTDIIRPMCSAKNLTLMTDFSGLKETFVSGDALKFSQIVINLLSNAVKFTPERGAVRFIAKEIPSLREDIVTVRFSVEDNGIGISQEDIKRIFEPFHRVNDKTVNQIEGTGLGLAIVKNYINAMGGNIHCESELGEGTTFTVELFFQRAVASVDHGKPPIAPPKDSFIGMRALVADDNHTNQLIAKEMMERMGFMLDFVDDGSAAVQKFRESSPYTYDVIYMDIQMPVMDGLTAAVQIRLCNHPQAQTIPIIAMTANAFTEDVEKAREAGMDGFVDKPIVSFKLAEQTRIAIQKKKGVVK